MPSSSAVPGRATPGLMRPGDPGGASSVSETDFKLGVPMFGWTASSPVTSASLLRIRSGA